MKRVAGAAALVLAAYLATLVALFPADVAWRMVEARLDLPVAIEPGALTGRMWNGRAEGLRVDGREIGAIAWHWQPGALLRGRLGLALRWQADAERVDARLRLGRGAAEVAGVRGTLAASRIQSGFDLPLLLEGQLELDVARIRWTADNGFEEARGALLWSGAGAGLPRPIPLGQYRAELDAEAGALGVRIESAPDSMLTADGNASWHPAGRYRVDLELRAAADADRNLTAALDAIARPQPDGSHRLQLEAGT